MHLQTQPDGTRNNGNGTHAHFYNRTNSHLNNHRVPQHWVKQTSIPQHWVNCKTKMPALASPSQFCSSVVGSANRLSLHHASRFLFSLRAVALLAPLWRPLLLPWLHWDTRECARAHIHKLSLERSLSWKSCCNHNEKPWTMKNMNNQKTNLVGNASTFSNHNEQAWTINTKI